MQGIAFVGTRHVRLEWLWSGMRRQRLALTPQPVQKPLRLRLYCLPHAPLSDRCDRSGDWRRNGAQVDIRGDGLGDNVLVGAVPRNVAGLVASVASFASRVKRASTWRSALFGDVTKLATGVALHGLCLAVTGKVVGATTLVASRSTACLESAASAEASLEATSADGSSTTGTNSSRALAVALSYISRLQALMWAGIAPTAK